MKNISNVSKNTNISIDTENNNSPFLLPIEFRFVKKGSKNVSFFFKIRELWDFQLFSSKLFQQKELFSEFRKGSIAIKIHFKKDQYRMAGNIFYAEFGDINSFMDLQNTIIDRVPSLLSKYKFDVDEVEDVMIMCIPFKTDVFKHLSLKDKDLDLYDKSTIGLNKKIIDKDRQLSAFMPNLIHFLDAASLTMLYDRFRKTSTDGLFFSIHDCYAVSPPNVEILKTILACVYTELYVDEQYLLRLDAF